MKVVEHMRPLSNEESRLYGAHIVDGYQYTTFTCEARFYLPWLMRKFVSAGGSIERRKVFEISKVHDLCNFLELFLIYGNTFTLLREHSNNNSQKA